MLIVEEGVYYERKDGVKVGPAVREKQWFILGDHSYFPNGERMAGVPEHDLIAPWLDTADAITPASPPVRVQILNAGASLTHGERDKEYGPPAINMAASGALKAAFRAHMARPIGQAELEAIDMCLTKLGRIATGTPKIDTYVDAATYLAIAGEIALTPDTPEATTTEGPF